MQFHTRTLHSFSSQETESIATNIGQMLRGGEIIELQSDLGGGKTTFTRGLARGAQSSDVVASPTFTVSKVYETPRFSIHHFDFYRLNEAALIAHEFEDLLHDPKVVLVVEWAGLIDAVMPPARVIISISKTGEDKRQLHVTYPEELAYLLGGV